MSETGLSRSVQKELRAMGAFVFKVHGSEYMPSGLPDLVICYQGRFIGLELKVDGNKASPRQEYIGGRIKQAGGIWAVVTSLDEVRVALKT